MKKLLKRIRNKWHSDIYSRINDIGNRITPPPSASSSPDFFGLWNTCAALQDDVSRDLFWGRLEYYLSHKNNIPEYGNMKMYQAMVHAGVSKQKSAHRYSGLGVGNVLELLSDKNPGKKNIYLYGYEDGFTWAISPFVDAARGWGFQVKGICFINRELNRESRYGVNVISEDALDSQNDSVVVCVGQGYTEEMKRTVKRALEMGFAVNQIFTLCDAFFPQYFENGVMVPSKNEIFVDVGAYDMSTSVDFINWCGGSYDSIYASEPDPKQYHICKEAVEKNAVFAPEKVKLYRYGLFSKTEKLGFFNPGGVGGSRISSSGSVEIETVSLDELLRGQLVTFIKMDIEGAELEALKGARDTIIKWKPRLAICVYHKPEDIAEIPQYILSLVPEYKLYIRHYTPTLMETVLFCVVS